MAMQEFAMSIFMPTEKNIHILKCILMSDFEMKSDHASEAIAALLGFQSYASFLTSYKRLISSVVYDVDFEAFKKCSIELGYDQTSSEYLMFIYKDILWPEPAWKIINKYDLISKNIWFHECRRLKIPFLFISKAKKYCSVEWDNFSMDLKYDDLVQRAAQGSLRELMKKIYKLSTGYAEPKSKFDGDALFGSVTSLSETGARQVANEFAKLLFPENLQAHIA